MTCGWWIRWLHRNRRNMDRAFIFCPLAGMAAARHGEGPEADQETLAVWLVHCALPGQEHWSCACGRAEQAQIIAMLSEGDVT